MNRKQMFHLRYGVMQPVSTFYTLCKLEQVESIPLFVFHKMVKVTGKTDLPLLREWTHGFVDAKGIRHSPANTSGILTFINTIARFIHYHRAGIGGFGAILAFEMFPAI